MSVIIAHNRVRAWLKSKWQVTVPDDWLTACIEWIHSENEGLPPDHSDLQQMVYEQWLVSDLRELGSVLLPEGLAAQDKVKLNGRYCLQVNSLVDVSVPYFGQLTKIRGKENENVNVSAATQQSQPSWEAKPSRMLMMNMTDGVQEIKGMEYKHIPSINPSLLPGAKVLVRGEVLCRNGVLMLTAENLSILGGEVESMIEESTLENNLQKALDHNTATKDQPQTERREFKTEPRQLRQPVSSQQVPQPRAQQCRVNQRSQHQQQQQSIPSQGAHNDIPVSDEWGEEDMDLLSGISDAELVTEQQWACDDDRDLEAMMEDIDDEVLASQEMFQMEQEMLQKTQPVQAVPPRHHLVPPAAPPDPAQRPMASIPCRSTKPPAPKPANRVSPWVASSSAVKQEPAMRTAQTRDSKTRVPVLSSASFPQGSKCAGLSPPERKGAHLDLHTPPFTYLSKVLESWPSSHTTVVTVKAYVSTLLDKLEHNNGSHWSLRAKINDGSVAIDVMLSDQILTSLIGFSALECLRMREVARQDKQARHRLTSGIKSCQEHLINMSALLEIKLDPSEPSPVVLRHRKATMEDFASLDQRIK